MKKIFVLSLVIVIAAMSVIAVSAAPRAGYYDQVGNKYWCNSDSYGCWVSGENGEHEYIMFWSESAADAIMGKNSGAPIGTLPGTSELNLAAPLAEAAKKSDGGSKPQPQPLPSGCTKDEDCKTGEKCVDGECYYEDEGSTCQLTPESCRYENPNKTCTVDGTDENCKCNCHCEVQSECGANYHWDENTCSCEIED